MPLVTAQELIDAGVHYGHQASRWNPKMKPFIHGKRHKIHVINLEETIRGLYQATHFVRSLAATGAQIMFLGTKKQIRPVVEAEAGKCNMPSVTERWIGGTLTNFSTVRERLTKLVEYENLEATGAIEKYKKKDQSMIRREIKRIRRNLDGVRELVQRRRRVAQLRLRPLRVDRVAPFKQSEGLGLVAQFEDDLRVLAQDQSDFHVVLAKGRQT